jgi:uncharacterized glyoxalase superfamily protein PhnB
MSNADPVVSDVYPSLSYDDAPAAVEWLCRAFGFTKRLVVPGPNGSVRHSELSLGPGVVVMVSSARPDEARVSPRSLPGLHQVLSVRVEDPDAHLARARAAGAVVVRDLQDEDYGSRGYMAKDLEGHLWYFGTYRPGAYWEGGASR